MRFGLTPEQHEYVVRTVVAPLERKGAIVWCYGSRARGDHGTFSDLDLMVESPRDLSNEISAIAEELQNGPLPIKVDLVPLADFAASYLSGFERDKVRFSPRD